jgi:hypothetical protein
MKKFIQNAFSRLLLLSTFTLIGLTSFGQFNYVPGTVYTFRTLISSTQTIQIDVEYDGNDNATVTLTNVSPQTGDKAYSHIFLPTNNEYTFDQNTGELEVTQNHTYYKKIEISNGTSTDYSTGSQIVPKCSGCNLGEAGANCKPATIQTSPGHWSVWCDWDGGEKICQKCADLEWVEDTNSPISAIIVIRASGNLSIQ